MRFRGQNMNEIKGDSTLSNHVRELVVEDYPTRRFAYKLTGTIWAILDEGHNWRYFTTI